MGARPEQVGQGTAHAHANNPAVRPADPYANSNLYSYADCDRYILTDGYPYSYAHANCDTYTIANGNLYANGNRNTHIYTIRYGYFHAHDYGYLYSHSHSN